MAPWGKNGSLPPCRYGNPALNGLVTHTNVCKEQAAWKSPHNWIISPQFSMLWRSLWKNPCGNCQTDKSLSLCDSGFPELPSSLFQTESLLLLCRITTGQQPETKQQRKPSQPTRFGERSPGSCCHSAACLLWSENSQGQMKASEPLSILPDFE